MQMQEFLVTFVPFHSTNQEPFQWLVREESEEDLRRGLELVISDPVYLYMACGDEVVVPGEIESFELEVYRRDQIDGLARTAHQLEFYFKVL